MCVCYTRLSYSINFYLDLVEYVCDRVANNRTESKVNLKEIFKVNHLVDITSIFTLVYVENSKTIN